MQFKTTTLLLVMATLAATLTLTAPAGPFWQVWALSLSLVVWGGVLLLSWNSSAPPRLGRDLFNYFAALLCIGLGSLGVCVCLANAAAISFSR